MTKIADILTFGRIFKTFALRRVWSKFIYMFLFVAVLSLFGTSCKTKEGCEINESAQVKMNKKGKKKSKTKSNLFPKKVRKKL